MTHLTERATAGALDVAEWAAWLLGATIVVAILAAFILAAIWTVAHLYTRTVHRTHVARTIRATRRGA